VGEDDAAHEDISGGLLGGTGATSCFELPLSTPDDQSGPVAGRRSR
jgi:hypothetical protein